MASTITKLAAYGMAATAALGGGAAGLAFGLGGGVAGAAGGATQAAATPAHLGGKGASLTSVAQVLGMSEADLRTALQGEKSLAQVAGERNVDVQEVVDAIVAAQTARIDAAVTAGRLTQAEADAKKAELPAKVKAQVERVGLPARPEGGKGGRGGGRGGPGGPALATAATALGIPEADLRTALQGGKSIAQVAQERGVDVQKVIDALVRERTDHLQQHVTEGKLTQAEADAKKAELPAKVKAAVERVGLPAKPGRGPRPQGAASTAATPSAVQTA